MADFQREPFRIQHPVWKACSKSLITYKTPATVLLNTDKSFRSFGYDAQKEYSHLCQKDETCEDFFCNDRFNEIVNKYTIHVTPEKNVEKSPGDVTVKSSPAVEESHIPDPPTLIEKKKSLKDHSQLLKAILERNKDETERLLDANMDPLLQNETGKTPFHIALDTKQPEIIKLISTVICKQFKSYIQSKYGKLLYKTWMGYTLEQVAVDLKSTFPNICIVGIYTEQPPCRFCKYFRGIPIRWRQKGDVSDEGRMTSQLENINVNFESTIPPELAKTLFKKHSNLTILHLSSVKSTNFSTKSSQIVEKPCLALYCNMKGYIPLGEKPFKETVRAFGPYEIDVREGILT